MALPQKNRLSSKIDFQRTIRKGRKIDLNKIRIFFWKSDRKMSRAAIVVFKKIDKRSSVRNRLRRQISEIILKNIPKLKLPYDIVVFPRFGAEKLKFQELQNIFNSIFKNLF